MEIQKSERAEQPSTTEERVLARQVAVELTPEELDVVAGGRAIEYTPTGCPEKDCD